MTETDLSFLGTDELFAEISSRYDGAVLVWTLDRGGEPHTMEIDYLYKSFPMALGLAEWVKNQLLCNEEVDCE